MIQGDKLWIGFIRNNKSKGYTVIKGKKKLDIGNLAILTGGRGNTLKKKQSA